MTVHLDAGAMRDSASENSCAHEEVAIRHYPRIAEIQEAVCAHFHTNLTEMLSSRRARAASRPRQVAMYLARHLTPRSLPEIGTHFGNRDHTTVIHAVRTIEAIRQINDDMEGDLIVLRLAISLTLGARLRRHGVI